MGGRSHVAAKVPFVEKEATNDDEVPQLLKNQLVMRSAPLIGRGLTYAGVGAIAYSANMPTTTTVQFSLQTKKAAKQRMIKTERGYVTQYEDAIFTEKKTGVKRVWLPGHPVAQTKRMARNPPIGVPTQVASPSKISRMRAMRIAGFGTVLLGKAVPVMAYGYVGYHLVTGGATSEDVDRVVFGGTYEEYKGMVTTIKNELPGRTYLSGVALRTATTVGVGMLTGIFS